MAPPTEETLKSIPGAFKAWQGLSHLQQQLRVLVLQGGKAKIPAQRTAPFQGAPPEVQGAIEALKARSGGVAGSWSCLPHACAPSSTCTVEGSEGKAPDIKGKARKARPLAPI